MSDMEVILRLESYSKDEWTGWDVRHERVFFKAGERVTERVLRDGQIMQSGSYPLDSDYARDRLEEFAQHENVVEDNRGGESTAIVSIYNQVTKKSQQREIKGMTPLEIAFEIDHEVLELAGQRAKMPWLQIDIETEDTHYIYETGGGHSLRLWSAEEIRR